MRVYYFQAPSSKARLANVRQDLLSVLQDRHTFFITNDGQNSLDMPKAEMDEIAEKGGSLLDKMDAFIIEGSTPDADLGYLLAYAISQRRPTLYLYDKDISNRGVLKFLECKNISSSIKVHSYGGNQAQKMVADFIHALEAEQAQELPTIKFTFRLTKEINDYLDWRAKKAKLKKADYLRKVIKDRLVDQDEDWKKR